MVVSFTGLPDTLYSVDATVSFTHPYWIVIGSVMSDALGNFTFEDPDPITAYPSRFYMASLPDVVPPTTPDGLTVTAVSPSETYLTWSAATDNLAVTTYQIFRDGTPIAYVSGARTNFVDTNLDPGTSYAYQVQAGDGSGNPSGLSSAVSGATPAAGAMHAGLVMLPNHHVWVTLTGTALGHAHRHRPLRLLRAGVERAHLRKLDDACVAGRFVVGVSRIRGRGHGHCR
jgi:hypothetical protein